MRFWGRAERRRTSLNLCCFLHPSPLHPLTSDWRLTARLHEPLTRAGMATLCSCDLDALLCSHACSMREQLSRGSFPLQPASTPCLLHALGAGSEDCISPSMRSAGLSIAAAARAAPPATALRKRLGPSQASCLVTHTATAMKGSSLFLKMRIQTQRKMLEESQTAGVCQTGPRERRGLFSVSRVTPFPVPHL